MSGEAGPGEEARGRGASLFVWSVWGVMLCASLGYAWTFSVDAPFRDDFSLVPVLSGERGFSIAWLWQQESDHRTPLPKLIQIGTARLTGHPFTGPVFFNFLGMAAAAALLILAARRLRGRTAVVDAFFPLLLLHGGPGVSLLRAILVNGVTRTLLTAAALLLVAGAGTAPASGTLLGVAACATGLALTGSAGLVLAVPLSAWVAWCLLRARPAGPAARGAVVFLVATGCVAAAYFAGFEEHNTDAGENPPARVATVALQVLGQAVGPAGGFGWKQVKFDSFGEGFPPLFSLGVTAVLLGALVLGFREIRAGRGGARVAGLCACTAGSLLACIAVGVGRAGYAADFGLKNHYALISAPGLAAAFLLLLSTGEGRLVRFVHAVLFLLMAGLLLFNTPVGWRKGSDHHRRMAAFAEAARRGAGPELLVRDHGAYVHPDFPPLLDLMRRMERNGIAPFPRRGVR